MVDRVGTVEGYRIWSASYDEPRNGLFDVDEPVLQEILDALPTGVALDAACGTGRHTQDLAARGHRVIGVDSSPDMLARARARVPGAEFRLGDLHRLPIADDEVDVVVCSLALTHLPVLGRVLAEFARVLRPGGHLLIADVHPDLVSLGANQPMHGPDGRPGRLVGYRHSPGDYPRAALPVGFAVRRCEEPGSMADEVPPAGSSPAAVTEVGPWSEWPFGLGVLAPEAARVAWNVPFLIIWNFQLSQA